MNVTPDVSTYMDSLTKRIEEMTRRIVELETKLKSKADENKK